MRFARVRSIAVAAAAGLALAGAFGVVAETRGKGLAIAWAEESLAWRSTLDDGCDAAKQSGRPVLVLTVWKQGVCNACDTFRSQVQQDARFAAAARRFELVEWQYDGLNGKVIPWTLANGGKSRDPSAQLFVVSPGGKVVARCATEKTFVASQAAEWLTEQAAAWEREHPRTAIPFRSAQVAVTGEVAVCAAVDEARAAGRPVLVYVAREGVAENRDEKTTKEQRARRAEASACRDLERGALDSKLAADAADGVTLVRIDLGDDAHAKWALALGVEKAPALLLFSPGEEKPVVLSKTITGSDLAARFKKLAAKSGPVSPRDPSPEKPAPEKPAPEKPTPTDAPSAPK